MNNSVPQQTLTDLFAEPSGLDKFVKQKQQEEAKAKAKAEAEKEMTETEIEQALQAAEDEADVAATRAVKAEQKAEVAEFDENIPWDETEAAMKERSDEMSKVGIAATFVHIEMDMFLLQCIRKGYCSCYKMRCHDRGRMNCGS